MWVACSMSPCCSNASALCQKIVSWAPDLWAISESVCCVPFLVFVSLCDFSKESSQVKKTMRAQVKKKKQCRAGIGIQQQEDEPFWNLSYYFFNFFMLKTEKISLKRAPLHFFRRSTWDLQSWTELPLYAASLGMWIWSNALVRFGSNAINTRQYRTSMQLRTKLFESTCRWMLAK